MEHKFLFDFKCQIYAVVLIMLFTLELIKVRAICTMSDKLYFIV